MELIASYNLYNKDYKMIIGCCRFSVRQPINMTINESLELIKKHPYSFVSVNKIMHMNDLESLEKYLKEVSKLKISGIIFSDLGVYQISKRLGISQLLIYNPDTLITNKMDLKFWEDKNIFGVFISPFITIDELKDFRSDLKIFYIGYGYLPLFYSKRPLVTNYCLHNGIKEDLSNRNMMLKEELRDGRYPILEDANGTFVYTPYIFNASQFMDELEKNIDFLVLDFNMIENDFIPRFKKREYGLNEKTGFLTQEIVYKK